MGHMPEVGQATVAVEYLNRRGVETYPVTGGTGDWRRAGRAVVAGAGA